MFYLDFGSTSPDRYSLSKFLEFDTTNGVYDVLNSYLYAKYKDSGSSRYISYHSFIMISSLKW